MNVNAKIWKYTHRKVPEGKTGKEDLTQCLADEKKWYIDNNQPLPDIFQLTDKEYYSLKGNLLGMCFFPFVFCAITYLLITSAQAVEFKEILTAVVIMYFVTDLFGGILHVVLDDERNMSGPLFVPTKGFLLHHVFPYSLPHQGLWLNCADISVVVSGTTAAAAFLMLAFQIRFDPVVLLCATLKAMFSYMGQYSHQLAHTIPNNNSWEWQFAQFLRSLGLIMTADAHVGPTGHHQHPHSTNFCILAGFWFSNTAASYFHYWQTHILVKNAIFYAFTAFDFVVVGSIIKYLFRVDCPEYFLDLPILN